MRSEKEIRLGLEEGVFSSLIATIVGVLSERRGVLKLKIFARLCPSLGKMSDLAAFECLEFFL